MHAVVLSFDRLHLGYLGCYGNEWIETPHFNRLAMESVVFDLHFGENFDPDAANHAWWTGRYQFPLDEDCQRRQRTLAEMLRATGVTTRLLIETGDDSGAAVAPPFDEARSVKGNEGMDVPEANAPFARLVSEAARLLETDWKFSESPSLVWLKSRGVPNPWVPPHEFTDLYFDEFDLSGEGDPEHVDLQYARALYAGYVTYLDRWLGKFLAALQRSPHADQLLLIVMAGAGERLGEHGPLGESAPVLHEELIHGPLMVRVPNSDQAGSRRQALVQTVDVAPTLLDWFGIPPQTSAADGQSLLTLVRNERDSIRDAAFMGTANGQWAIRTPEFLYVTDREKNGMLSRDHAQLFEKPQDRWEIADVLPQYQQDAVSLESTLLRQVETVQTRDAEV